MYLIIFFTCIYAVLFVKAKIWALSSIYRYTKPIVLDLVTSLLLKQSWKCRSECYAEIIERIIRCHTVKRRSSLPHRYLISHWTRGGSMYVAEMLLYLKLSSVCVYSFLHVAFAWPIKTFVFLLKGYFSNVSYQPVFGLHGLFNTNCFSLLVYKNVQNTTHLFA